MRSLVGWLAVAAAMTLGVIPISAAAQVGSGPDRVVTTAASERYRAGVLQRWILGRHYRDLWAVPVRVEVLDLATFAGGLEPLRTGGGLQTRSLRFLGADGREYTFRSVDKDPALVLDSILRETIIADLVQDGISAAHPYGALVAAPLLEAAGILHVEPQLRVMPDDPALGEFREEFAGMLGLIEERPDENEGERAAFRGTEEVIASEELLERLERGPADRVAAPEFLKARLMDVLLGDWDRHRGQWRWATFDRGDRRSWLPVPRDRDQAFSKFDGVATRIVSLFMPQFVRFEADYPAIKRLHWNGREVDRRFLAELDRRAWDSVGAAVQVVVTDDVIARAVRQLPPEIYEVNGQELASALRARRDHLDEAWDEFYGILAGKVDVHATNVGEVVLVDRSQAGTILVTMTSPDALDRPYFSRRFETGDTREVRIYLRGGDDSVVIRGDAETRMLIRLIGGEGDDRFDFEADGAGVRLYDFEGANEVFGEDAPRMDARPFREWVWTEEDRDQPADWGHSTFPIFWSTFSTDLGLFLGGGVRLEGYGFRRRPYSTGFDIRGGYSPVLGKGRLEIDGRVNAENSAVFRTFSARVSRLDVFHYYGLGNQSLRGAGDYNDVDLTSTSASLGMGVSPDPSFALTAAVTLERSSTRPDPTRFFQTLGPIYGSGVFVQVGLGGGLTFDPLVEDETTGNRLRLEIHATAFPKAFDVTEAFGRARGELSALLASSPSPAISLAVRAGAEKLWGQFPWHEAAFIGGTSTLRGWDEQRFAGDAGAYMNGEVRLRVGRPRVVVPVGVGIFGFVDAGRVSVDGASPGGWHTGVGGGVYFRPVKQPYVLRLGTGWSPEATKLFLSLGLEY